jgi:hypothetical protein
VDAPFRLWLPLDFQYKHKGGGSNGASIGTAWYVLKTGEWVYKPAGMKGRVIALPAGAANWLRYVTAASFLFYSSPA